MLAFGAGAGGSIPFTPTINTAVQGRQITFTVSQDCTLTSIAGFCSSPVNFGIAGTTINAFVQIFIAAPKSNTFSLLPSSILNILPGFVGTFLLGDSISGEQNLSIPISAWSRLLFVVNNTVTETTPYASALAFYWAGSITLAF
jgi:hypothetical protein